MAEKLNLKKLAFIGGGAMGEAIIKGITTAKLMDPAAICVGAHRQERAEYLHDTYAPQFYTIPMPGNFNRSLNLANSTAIAVYEGLRRILPGTGKLS